MKRTPENITAAVEYLEALEAGDYGLQSSILNALNYIIGRPGGTVVSREKKNLPTLHIAPNRIGGGIDVWVSNGYFVKNELKQLGFHYDSGSENWSKTVAPTDVIPLVNSIHPRVAGYDYDTGEDIFTLPEPKTDEVSEPEPSQKVNFPPNFQDRIKNNGITEYVDLIGPEKDLYHNCGYHLACVEDGQITDLRILGGDMTHGQEMTDYVENKIEPWLRSKDGAEIFVGMCSCYQFVEPERIFFHEESHAKQSIAKIVQLIQQEKIDNAPHYTTIVYTDAALNKWEKTVNNYGKKIKGSNGYRCVVTDADGKVLAEQINTRIEWANEAEAFAHLKAVEWAAANGITDLEIRTDNLGATVTPKKNKTAQGKYVWVREKIARENGINVTFRHTAGTCNPADAASRKVTDLDDLDKNPATQPDTPENKARNDAKARAGAEQFAAMGGSDAAYAWFEKLGESGKQQILGNSSFNTASGKKKVRAAFRRHNP